MNKEFRVWDGIRFLWPSEFCLFPEDDGTFSPRRLAGYGELRDIPNSVIQQYTGLTDSTGKKIFEGDIIGYNQRKWEVVWNDGGFFEIKDGEYLWEVCNKMEVIGNIFETPELLKL